MARNLRRQMEEIDRARAVLSSGLDPHTRTIYLHGDLTPSKVRRFIVNLAVLAATPGRVLVNLFSDGGAIEAGFAVVDAIEACPAAAPIWVVGTGECCSMAAVILQFGARRLLTPNARLMVHNPWVRPSPTPQEERQLGATALDLRANQERLYGTLMTRSGLSRRQVKRLCDKETYLLADQALKLRLVDAIYRGDESNDETQTG